MHNITLVFSAHVENGRCNAAELLKILRAIEPEVVFEEIRPSEFHFYYEHGHVEAHAIAKYREFKSFQEIPVDRYDMPDNFFTETQRVFDCVEQASQEYLELDEEKNNRAHQYGFQYLNSVAFTTIMARIHEIEEQTIIGTRDQDLICGLERWRHVMQKREAEMIGSIYEYCRENVFDTGVFLVGAAHKLGIVKEIEKYASTEADLINWNFAYDGQIS
jgi:hypothetical protein